MARDYANQPVVFLEYDVDLASGPRYNRFWAAYGSNTAYLPLAIIDSGNQYSTGYQASYYQTYKAMVDTEMARPPKAQMTASWMRNGNKVQFKIQLTNLSPVTLSTANFASVFGIVYEDAHVGVSDRFVRAVVSAGVNGLAPNATASFTLETNDLVGVNWTKLHFLAVSDYRPAGNSGAYDMLQAAIALSQPDVQFLGTWTGQGVYYQSSDTGTWTKLATPADLIACGDLYGDGIADLIGIWSGQAGVWVKNSANGSWAYLGSSPRHIAAGDMNGDGRADLLGTWDSQGVFYRNSISGAWSQMATPATLITAGDLDGDGKADLIGIWPSQAGVWVKYSQTGNWNYLGSSTRDLAVGDMNGDGRADLVGTWDGQGVFYKDSISGNWAMMATPADQIAAGDLDGDGTDDLIGIWAGQAGVWVKYSASGQWAYIGSSARDIAVGKMSGGTWGSGLNTPTPLNSPSGGLPDGPSRFMKFDDISAYCPGGNQFLFEPGRDPIPRLSKSDEKRIPGPGEPGFRYLQGKNLFPMANRPEENNRKKSGL